MMADLPSPQTVPYIQSVEKNAQVQYRGNFNSYLATTAQTDGKLMVSELVMVPGTEPPPHIHTKEDEAYFIMAGTVIFSVGGESYEISEGTFIWLPRLLVHSFKVVTEEARALVFAVPSGLEGYFQEMKAFVSSHPSELALRDPQMQQEMLAIGEKYGLIFPDMTSASTRGNT